MLPPLKVRVMVVDDSSVMRGMLTRTLEAADMQVVATAASCAAALSLLKRPAPHKVEADVLFLDVQTSGRNGAAIITEFRKAAPTIHIIVAATLNESNVMQSIDALDQGADELVPKPSSRKDPEETANFINELLLKIKKLSGLSTETKLTSPPQSAESTPIPEIAFSLRKAPTFFRPKAVAIASSTGGPKALHILLEGIGKHITDLPIFLTQHMPKDFTASLAQQLEKISGVPSAEGKDREIVHPGYLYVAPGDYHMLVKKEGDKVMIRLNQEEQENFCRPAADPMLRSLYSVYGKDLLVVILTGMGQDGLLGAKLVAENGGMVIAQDKASSVVWGMPGAVAKEGICTHVLPIHQLADVVVKICNGKGI